MWVCAQESAALPALSEKLKESEKQTNLLRQKAQLLYDTIMSKQTKLAEMPVKSPEDIDLYNELMNKINKQVKRQKKAVENFNQAATKLNIAKAKIEKRRTDYTANCTNIYFRRKHLWIVCGKEEYKNTNFCKQR